MSDLQKGWWLLGATVVAETHGVGIFAMRPMGIALMYGVVRCIKLE